jgi:hypothetical protein
VLRLRRPDKPAIFDARVEKVIERVREAIEKYRQEAIGNGVNRAGQKVKKPTISDAVWAKFKHHLMEAQLGRCGFCECPILDIQYGDVEHFAPKNEVSEFDGTPGEEGTQVPWSTSVQDRRPRVVADTGYWWLAYDWGNYLLACSACNSVWKGSLFPVRQPPARTLPPADLPLPEEPLILDPYGPQDPADHITFRADGDVEPLTELGRETIRVLGLHRVGLVMWRRLVLENAYRAVADAMAQQQRGAPVAKNSGLTDLHRMGRTNQLFPGAVRAVIRQQIDLTWEDLDGVFG